MFNYFVKILQVSTDSNNTNGNVDRKVWLYDIEQLSNFHSIVLINVDTAEEVVFIIHRSRNDLHEYLTFLRTRVKGMIGYNSLNYDYPLLHYILTELRHYEDKFDDGDFIAQLLYQRSQEIIASDFSAIAPWNVLIPQLDLYKIHHFDNAAKRTSLKDCEFALRWHNVQDMPLKHYDEVTEKDIPSIIDYNFNDVYATGALYRFSKDDIQIRKMLKKQYSSHEADWMNFSDSKIGSEILGLKLADELNMELRDLKQLRSPRATIAIKDVIAPNIKFRTAAFNKVLEKFQSKVLEGTKNQFKNTFPYRGAKYVYATGGLHAASPAGVYKPKDDEILIDIDVASFYPRIAITNGFFPEHLGEKFCKVYEDAYNYRLHLKSLRSKDPLIKNEIGTWKLALNGTYGNSGNKYSMYYDPKFTMSITINGQLVLSMLIERVLEEVKGALMVQANTDGVTFIIKKETEQQLYDICKRWENYTGYMLEYTMYRQMVMRDANNYLAEYDKEDHELYPAFPDADWYDNEYTKHKTKGVFQVVLEQNGKIALNKDWSNRVLPKAWYDYFIKKIPIRDSIYNNENILDFCARSKATSNWNAMYVNNRAESEYLSKTNRYYCSINGGKLLKDFHNGKQAGKKVRVEAQARVTIMNKLEEKPIEDYMIDYSHYMAECNKVINVVEQYGQQKLFA